MKENFTVLYKDTRLLDFAYDADNWMESSTLEAGAVHTDRFDAPGISGNLESWLASRVIPKNRAFVNQILAAAGAGDRTMDKIKVSLGLSLNDNYWVRPEWLHGGFGEYNLFENDFSEALALVAFTGHSEKISGLVSSPELSTDGQYPKCWRRIGGVNKLYKAGTEGYANAGAEPYCEFYASQIAEKMGVNSVRYGITKWKEKVCSVCGAFTDLDTSYVSFSAKYGRKSVKEILGIYDSLGFLDEFITMVIYDAIVFNCDRHLGNFGFLYNLETGMFMPFPVFDENLALAPGAFGCDLDSLESLTDYLKGQTSSFGTPHDTLVKQLITGNQKDRLRKLINFSFKRDARHNFPDNRIKLTEEFIQWRVNTFLSL